MPENLGTVLTEVWSQVGLVVTTITGSALLLIPIGFSFARKAIGATKSLLGGGGGRRGR